MTTELQGSEAVENTEEKAAPSDRREEVHNDRRAAMEKAISKLNKEETEAKEPKAEIVAEEPSLNAPAEWESEDKEDFKVLSRKQQEATLKLHSKRQKWFDSIRKEAEDVKHYRQMEQDVAPYLKAMDGKGVDPRTAMFKAIQLYKAAESNPNEFISEFVKAKQLDGWTKTQAENAAEKIVSDPTMQKDIFDIKSELSSRREAEDRESQELFKTSFESHWSDFENTTNEAGSKKFPSISNTEEGIKLASNIGSLVGGQTELSKQFLSNVKTQNPDATYTDALIQAYKYFGGKVSDSREVPQVPKSNQFKTNNIRASASVPGRTALAAKTGGATPLYADRRDAALAAIRKHRGE